MTHGKYVLGVSALFHDSAAALVCGREVIAAAQEERFTRVKGDWAFPRNAIDYCLGQLPPGAQLDALAYYENPRMKIDRIFQNAIANAPGGAPLFPPALRTLQTLNRDLPGLLLGILGDAGRIRFCEHHRSHAASAYYPSPFEECAVLVVDGVGEWSTTSIWSGRDRQLRLEAELAFPNSLGLLYSAFTQYCGFKVNSGEYKLMGLAPFGRPIFRKRILQELIDLKPDGSFALNMNYFGFHKGLSSINPLFGYLFGVQARHPNEPMTQHFMDVAASIQSATNEVMCGLAAWAMRATGSKHLVMAGGVALNCVANSEIIRHTEGLESVWIQPAAGDAGGALGAALAVAQELESAPAGASHPFPKTRDDMQGAYLGPEYGTEDMRSALEQSGLAFETFPDESGLMAEVARRLADGDVVGNFHGRMEFGPRALGNRSILADPRPAGTLNRVNRKIKFREGWRPFAPVVLAEHADHYFEGPNDSPYMLLVSDIREAFRGKTKLAAARATGTSSPGQLQALVTSDFPAITHVDFSSRLQTVSETSTARIRKILEAFYLASGCPILLNTSFNVRGEPIICTPAEAIDCFLNTNMDVLVLGNYLVCRSAQGSWVEDRIGKVKFRAD